MEEDVPAPGSTHDQQGTTKICSGVFSLTSIPAVSSILPKTGYPRGAWGKLASMFILP